MIKYKIGDRVRVKEGSEYSDYIGKKGIIWKYQSGSGSHYKVRLDNYDYAEDHYHGFPDSDLELIGSGEHISTLKITDTKVII